MQFKVGDLVVHSVYRMGHITAIEKRQFFELQACLYYQIAFPKSIIWIPIEAQETVGLRLVTAKSDLDQYRDLLKSPPAALAKGSPQRGYMELTKRLKSGTFPVMCEVVRDLTASNWKKPLSETAKAILRKTRERLYQEWAIAAGISITEATKEINSLLQATQEADLK